MVDEEHSGFRFQNPAGEDRESAESAGLPASSVEYRETRTETRGARRQLRVSRGDLIVTALLILTLVVAGAYRFINVNWDENTRYHPDERFLTQVASALGATDLGGYFDTYASQINPNNVGYDFYVYGTLPLFTVKAVASVYADLTDNYIYTGYGGVHLVGRTVSAVADMVTVLLVFLIGRRLYGKWVGLLGAMFYAGSALAIQLSHFFTTDAFTVVPVALAMWFAVRAMDENHWYDYALFGVAFGAAMASRINVIPLAGTLALAALVRLMPALELDMEPEKRLRLAARIGGLLVLGAVVSVVVFRLAQPYAFTGPTILGVGINQRWMGQMQAVQAQVSGQVDFPPNHQWAMRTHYLFPLGNIIQWGLGTPLGIAAWLGWVWAGWRILRGREDWTRHLLPFVWILIYFGWQGRQWVMSMRYYIILYPFLALFAAWALVKLVEMVRGISLTPALPDYSPALPDYSPTRGEGTSSRADSPSPFMERGPGGEVKPAGVRGLRPLATAGAAALLAFVLIYTHLYAYGFTGIYRRTFTRAEASRWFRDNVPGDIGMYVQADDGSQRLISLNAYNGFWQTATDETLDTDAELIRSASWLGDGQPASLSFTAPVAGTVSSVVIPHLGDPQRDAGEETFHVAIAAASGENILAEGNITGDFAQSGSPLGDAAEIVLDKPVALAEGQTYYVIVEVVSGGPVTIAGAIIGDEGPWDDPVPTNIDGWDGFGMGYYNSIRLYMSLEDSEQKRQIMTWVLDNADYLTIASNRFYDSLARNPVRFPMSIRYYQALFSCELGYELVEAFTSFPSVGPFELNDRWAEEAWHVYDHPIVMVFRRTEAYDPARTRAIFAEFDMEEIANAGRPRADQVSQAPTALELPDKLWQRQTLGGTWSQRYDSESAINRSDALAVLAWWALIVVVGRLAFPLLFAALPGLPDKGYPLANVLGLIFVSWLPWLLASSGLALWNAAGIALGVVILGILGMAAFVAKHSAILDYVRRHWGRMLVTDAITLVVFGLFLFIRLGNPDLWHQSFGGEKPMDFAYFNAVLRSTVFPPYDPWFAGGYINYYYYGYVIVGGPVLLLGLVPVKAYNLIIPTLAALTGIGAFSIAFNLVAGLKARAPRDGLNRWVNRRASPWLAGAAALTLAVILGNLDTVRVLIGGLARTGGWAPETGKEILPPLQSVLDGLGTVLTGGVLSVAPHRWYWAPTRVLESFAGNAINEFPFFTFLYADLHAHMIAMPVTLLAITWALGEIQSADTERRAPWVLLSLFVGALSVGLLDPTNHWDWVTYMVVAVGALTFASFLTLKAQTGRWPFAWAAAEGNAWLIAAMGLLVAAVTVATVVSNKLTTWILLALVAAGALTLTNFLHLRPQTRGLLLNWAVRVVAFLGLALLVVLPFNLWFGTTYSSIQYYQSGDTTPLWAYLDMHGIFLFLAGSLLAWETVVWLHKTRVEALRGKAWWLGAFAAGAVILLAAVLFLAFVGLPTQRLDETGAPVRNYYRPLLVAAPLLVWALLLFFRPDQGREKQVALAAVALAIALTLGVEFVVLVGDIGRQNTIFKFYIQVWLLLSAAGGAMTAWLWRAVARWWAVPRAAWMALFAALVLMGALYPIMATRGKFTDRMSPDAPNTLDGMAYMQYASHGENGQYFALKEDYDAIRWLQENIRGTPVILEAQLGEYHWGSRVSIYTGLPTVLGWNWHQRQQRTTVPQQWVWDRATDVAALYNTTDEAQALQLLRRYDVSYIMVGELERASYDAGGLAKFEQMARQGLLERVYDQEGTRIYQVAW